MKNKKWAGIRTFRNKSYEFLKIFLDYQELVFKRQVALWVWVIGFDTRIIPEKNYNVGRVPWKKITQLGWEEIIQKVK